MNAFDYFFERTSDLEKPFLVGRENVSFKELHNSSLRLASWLTNGSLVQTRISCSFRQTTSFFLQLILR